MSAKVAMAPGAMSPKKAGSKAGGLGGRSRSAGPKPRRGVSKMDAAKRVGLPPRVALAGALLIVALAGVVVLATGGRGRALVAGGQDAFSSRLGSLGLRVGEVHLQGASQAAQAEILEAAGVKPGQPILDLDLAAVRARVEKVGWVQHARVIRLLPDTVVIAVDQRPLMAVWEHAGRATVVANNGAVVSEVDPSHFSALPLVVGDGANTAAAALLPLIADHPRLEARLEALIRVDDRRWNLRLKDGAVILLSAADEAGALSRLDRLDRSSRIFDLGLARIDLRDPEMVVVRPREAAPADVSKSGA